MLWSLAEEVVLLHILETVIVYLQFSDHSLPFIAAAIKHTSCYTVYTYNAGRNVWVYIA